MKNLQKLYNECKKELDNLNISYGNIITVNNFNVKHTWGRCWKKGNDYKIEISDKILQDTVSDKATKTVILHELLHTCNNCMAHTGTWKKLANYVNYYYGYQIKRVNSAQEFGLGEEKIQRHYKYSITCKKCGATWYRERKCGLVTNPNNYRCGCGCNDFVVKELD